MLKRQCNKCEESMERGEPFYKVCRAEMEKYTQRLIHVGDLCEKCWNEVHNIDKEVKKDDKKIKIS